MPADSSSPWRPIRRGVLVAAVAAGVVLCVKVQLDHFRRVDLHGAAYRAVQSGAPEAVLAALDRGLELDRAVQVRPNRNADTLLMIAAAEGQVEVVRALLERGADVHRTNEDGRTALTIAAGGDLVAVMDMLVEAGADPRLPSGRRATTALMTAAGAGATAAVRRLLELGVDPNAVDRDGLTALMAAARSRSAGPETARALLEAGADAGALTRRGESALTLGASVIRRVRSHERHVEMLLAIIAAGPDPNVVPRSGETALLHVAAHSEVLVEALLAAGADPKIADRRGRTPLLLAAEEGTAKTVRLLLDAGADPAAADTRTWNEPTPLDRARTRQDKDGLEIQKLLNASLGVEPSPEDGDAP